MSDYERMRLLEMDHRDAPVGTDGATSAFQCHLKLGLAPRCTSPCGLGPTVPGLWNYDSVSRHRASDAPCKAARKLSAFELRPRLNPPACVPPVPEFPTEGVRTIWPRRSPGTAETGSSPRAHVGSMQPDFVQM